MDFVQVDIEDVVKYFAERLQQKFIYDPSILSGKITIISPSEVTLQEAYGAFLSAMEVRGYVIYPAGPYHKIEKAANARKVPTPIHVSGTPNDDSFVTRIYTLKFLNVNDIRQAVRNLLSRTGGDVIEHAPTNTLIISDYAYNIRRIVRILDILDVEGFQERIEIIQLKNASAVDVARQINEFFPPQSGAGGSSAGRRVGAGRPAGEGGAQAVVQKVVADERTNSLFLLGSDRGIEQVRDFIAKVDKPVAGGGGLIHVYPIQNVKAEDIAQTLSALASGQSSKRRSGSGGSIPSPIPGAPPIPSPSSGGGDSTTATLLNGDVKITADAATNSLVIQASQRDFEVLKGIIRKLDIRRRQVFIESAILEASVRRGSTWNPQYGGPFAQTSALGRGNTDSSFIGAVNGFDLQGILQNPSGLTGMALGFRSGNVTVSTVDPKTGAKTDVQVPILSALLRISASTSDLNVISTPHILATANEEAKISIGETYPEKRGDTIGGNGIVSQNFVDVTVATELIITPQINQDDYLTLKIDQKIDERGDKIDDSRSSQIRRSAKSTVIVKDQQTIVMGGLMKDGKAISISKVPFLGDIPILGWLFKTRTVSSEKRNLLLFLTPYIIKDTADMNNNFFRKLKEREGFLKDLGVSEKQGVPTSGLTPDQLKMLDPAYVKSLKLDPLPTVPEEPAKNETPANNTFQNQFENDATPLVPADAPADNAPSIQPIEPALPNGNDLQPLDLQPLPSSPTPQVAPQSAPVIEPSLPPIDLQPIPPATPSPAPSLTPSSAPVAPAPAPEFKFPTPPGETTPKSDLPAIQLEDTPPEN